MRFAHTLFAMAAGAIVTATLILACGDDSPPNVDAADGGECDCPVAEPPLGGRIVQVEDVRNPGNSEFPAAGATCPDGSVILGGGCHVDDDNDDALVLYASGGNTLDGLSYGCQWHNPSGATIDETRAWAVCLIPAE